MVLIVKVGLQLLAERFMRWYTRRHSTLAYANPFSVLTTPRKAETTSL